MRDILHHAGLHIDQHQGLLILRAIVDVLFENGNLMKSTANTYMSDYRTFISSNSQATGSSPTATTQDDTEYESARRNIDWASRRVSEQEGYSSILGASPRLTNALNAYMICCNQKNLYRSDRVVRVFCMLIGPTLCF